MLIYGSIFVLLLNFYFIDEYVKTPLRINFYNITDTLNLNKLDFYLQNNSVTTPNLNDYIFNKILYLNKNTLVEIFSFNNFLSHIINLNIFFYFNVLINIYLYIFI